MRVAVLEQQMAQVLQVQAAVVAHALAVSSRLDTPDASARLLSAIARAYGGRVFTAADLSSSMDEELRAVLVGKDGRRVGAWLRRLHVCPVPPYTLRRVGRDGPGVLWTVTIESR